MTLAQGAALLLPAGLIAAGLMIAFEGTRRMLRGEELPPLTKENRRKIEAIWLGSLVAFIPLLLATQSPQHQDLYLIAASLCVAVPGIAILLVRMRGSPTDKR